MKRDTLIVAGGRHPEDHYGLVNPPIYRGSTVLHRSLAHLEETGKRPYDSVRYGRLGTPTTFAFEEAMAALEGGKDGSFRSVAVSSGMAACAVALMAFLKAGDHVLITDSVYAPVRRFADALLADFGVATTFYDPRAGADADRLRELERNLGEGLRGCRHVDCAGDLAWRRRSGGDLATSQRGSWRRRRRVGLLPLLRQGRDIRRHATLVRAGQDAADDLDRHFRPVDVVGFVQRLSEGNGAA